MPPSPLRRAALRAIAGLLLLAGCSAPAPIDANSAAGLPLATLNDLRQPAGRVTNDTLLVAFDVVQAAWTPRAATGPRVPIRAFAERGQAPSVPGPLVRLAAGTTLRLSVRNTLPEPVTIRSLMPAGGLFDGKELELASGQERVLEWTPTGPVSSAIAVAPAEGLGGASLAPLVVDPAGTAPPPDERILLLSAWGSQAEPGSLDVRFSWKMLVNGRSWPFTERFDFTVGDSVRWRVINASPEWHPMHLHGFFFKVTSTGDMLADTTFRGASTPDVVTHTMAPRTAMTIAWTPTTPGNWLFHCHLLRHMGPTQAFVNDVRDTAMMADGMGGMITGITVRPASGAAIAAAEPTRHMALWTTATPNGHGSAPRLGFVLQQGSAAPRADSAPTLSSLLVLQQQEPTAITVHNRLEAPLSVHWHGLELPSAYDGVGHWSGMPGMTRPPIGVGDSTVVHMQPPRAGTFIYHTHGEEGAGLAQGLYGPLVVLPPGEAYDPDRDRIFVLGAGGAARDADPAINGERELAPQRFEKGRTYRLRFIQIGADEVKTVSLLRNGEPVTWRAIAKDGADLPEGLRTDRPARFRAGVGETNDFEWTPPDDAAYQLVVRTVSYPVDINRGPTQTVAFAVGAVSESAVSKAHEGFDGVLSLTTLQRLFEVGTVVVPLLLLALLGWGGRYLWRRWRRRRAPALA